MVPSRDPGLGRSSPAKTHLDDVGLSYFAHLRRASWIGIRMVGAGFACLVHGLLPGIFITQASRTVEQLELEFRSGPRIEPAGPATESLSTLPA